MIKIPGLISLGVKKYFLQLPVASCFMNVMNHVATDSAFIFAVVFMGSEKYPDENAFDAFIKKHGGSDNASTDCERVS